MSFGQALDSTHRRRNWVGALALVGAYLVTRSLQRSDTSAPAGQPQPRPARRGWPFWKSAGLKVYRRIGDDRLLAVAAGVVFYGLLALFPAITALVSSYALFANASTIQSHLDNLSGFMPGGAYGIVQEQVARIVASTTGGLSLTFLFGLALAVWSANAGVKAMLDALNVAYELKERRGFVALNALSLAFTVGAIAAVLLAFAGIVVLPVAFSYVPGISGWIGWLRWPALGVLLLAGLGVLYRFGPAHETPYRHWITPGAAFGAVAWLAGSALLSWYLADFANYDATYGSLGAAIGLMMWLWMSAIVVLVGAEINSVLDNMARDSEELAARSGF
jgi:membrane protein